MNGDGLEDIGKASTLLQALVKDLRSNQNSEERVAVLADRITNLTCRMHQLTFERADNNAVLIQIHSNAVTLWNIAVAMKTGSGQTGTTENAKLRHAACKLSFFANAAETCEVTYRKQLVMTTKTGRAWLEIVGKTTVLLKLQCWNGLQKSWSSRDEHDSPTPEQSKQIAECERYMFRVYCYRAETSFSMCQQDRTQLNVAKAKEFMGRLPAKECITLAELCYNFGVDTYYREEYEKCIAWLRESYDIRKENGSSGANKRQATTLRLMANAYLDWDSKQHWQMALNAADLANSEHGHPAGLYLKAKLLLMGNGDEELPCSRLWSAFEDTLRHPDLKVDLGLCAVNLAVQYKRTELTFDCLKILESRFKNSPDLYKVQLEHLELLLTNNKDEDAKALIEKCIVDQMERSLDFQICQRFHILLWEKAASAYERKSYREALDWYNYSLSFFSSKEEDIKNIGKLLRNKCSCYMNLQDYEKAKEVIVEAEQSDPDSPVIQFYKFKIALAEGQDVVAVDAMTKISEVGSNQDNDVAETNAHGLICLAAQLALEQKNHNVAVNALEKVVASSADNQQVLTSLRCLTRLKLTQSTDSGAKKDYSSFLLYLQTALDRLNQMELVSDSNVQTEAIWFMKIAWNLALESTDCCTEMQELFLFCYKFSCLCLMESSNLVRQKNCLVMAAASAVQAAREKISGDEKTKLLRKCLGHVDACRVLRKKIGIGGLNSSLKDESLLLLALYEFEAKAQLGDSDLCFCLDAAEALLNADPGTFETFAALAVEPPAYHREISMRALRIAIKKHLAMDVIDFTKLSKAFHSLVHHALSSGSSSDAESKEEAFAVYQDICKIIENQAKGCYPEIQILWLMTKAWNCGVNLFSAGGHEAGEKWCGLAMKLLHHLSTFKCNYQDKMTKVYGDILDRMERNTLKGQVEE
ncbi:unnamed protein product [Pocillopora meandrina]|uniref:Protein ZIP4 homolog n=1 Tax=Pocillopora meandrina TaxID=46732 RepID=A0AAU9WP65_9CNID|nr:unnamed protein product [Pocillopora meandrina]